MRASRGARLPAFALGVLIPSLGVVSRGAEAVSLHVANGPAGLYAGCSFAQAGEANLNGIARYNSVPGDVCHPNSETAPLTRAEVYA